MDVVFLCPKLSVLMYPSTTTQAPTWNSEALSESCPNTSTSTTFRWCMRSPEPLRVQVSAMTIENVVLFRDRDMEVRSGLVAIRPTR